MWIEQKYIGMVSPRLERFKRTGSSWVFRCPFCGDSKKSKSKTRGNLYVHKNSVWFGCFNCDLKMGFGTFLKRLDPVLYSEYKLELIRETNNPPSASEIRDKQVYIPHEETLIPVSKLGMDHPARQYCHSRMIPESKLTRIHFVENLREYVVSKLGVKKYKDRNLPQDSRIVFEMRDQNGKMFGFQSRTIDPFSDKKLRFITIKFDDNFPKVYGLDHVNLNEYPIIVTEGIIDSLFLPNCLAICGGDVGGIREVLKSVPCHNVYVCLDNEPRHKDTISRMKLAIDMGYNVMFWKYDSSMKDVNDMVKNGLSIRGILESIKKESHRGAAANLALNNWKKI